jgi:hypothetical protein
VSEEAGEALRGLLEECGVEAEVKNESAFGGRLVVMSVELINAEVEQIRSESLEAGGVA